jgi:uncharacterized protein with HEPN domain
MALTELLFFVGDSSEQEFMERRDLQIIAERLLEVIGEIAHHLSESFIATHPEIDWPKMVGQRNILAHEYGDIDYEMLWDTVVNRVPGLEALLNRLLAREG